MEWHNNVVQGGANNVADRDLINALYAAQEHLYHAAGMMIRRGGVPYEAHGIEMMGAARMIGAWVDEIRKEG